MDKDFIIKMYKRKIRKISSLMILIFNQISELHYLLPLSRILTIQELTFDKFTPTFPEITELNMRLEVF